jgi:ParB family transcriptional regulator, chromosome partitioning protein
VTKRALIAEPDPEEALRQAAILKDDGYETLVFSGADLVAELEANPHDIVILRHERPGAQTGLALVSRLKQVAPGAAIVITTSDLTPDAIEKNRKQKVHADGYLRLPVERSELVAAARAMPSAPAKAAAGQSQEGAPVLEDGTGDHRAPGADGERKRPPPLPAAGLRALSPLAKAGPRGAGGEAVLTTEDLTFVEKVFSTIQHIDADAPVQEPPPSAIGDAGDRKVALLRSELKRRERELAKLSRLWKAREEDLRQKESRVQAKDIELEGLRLRIAEVTGELERANQTLVEKEAEFGRAMGETYDQTALEQAEYSQQVAAIENELNAL